jgi:hypothetical protein
MEQDFTVERFKEHRDFINKEVNDFLMTLKFPNARVLEVGPSETLRLKDSVPECSYFSCDIIERTDIDFQMDLTVPESIPTDQKFDIIICAEVLEHVVNPFSAVESICKLLDPGGAVITTTPLNGRIHGPIPDCWRFTEFGLRVLFRDFDIIRINRLDTPGRPLFPLHYSMLAIKPKVQRDTRPQDIAFVKVKP